MKTLHLSLRSASRFGHYLCFARALAVTALLAFATAHGADGDDREEAPAPAQRAASSSGGVAALSPLVAAVVKLADASISATVIQTYVECSLSSEPLTEADIIELKNHRVADEIVTAMLKRTAKLRATDAHRKDKAAIGAAVARTSRLGVADPESYEYFQYYYLQPRAVASASQRLSPYYGPWSPYRYGPAPGFGRPHHGLRFRGW